MTRKERFERLLERKKMSQTDLLRKIFQEMDPEKYDKVRNHVGNFNKMIKGERDFPEEYIVVIEEILETTMLYIYKGVDQSINNKEFNNYGIRYAAFTDDIKDYEQLNRFNEGYNILDSYDEFDKNILDYIIEYKAKNGLYYAKRRIKQELDGYSSLSDEKLLNLFNLLCENDDPKLFEEIFFEEIKYSLKDNKPIFKNGVFLSGILQSNNIFNSLIKSTKKTVENLDDEAYYFNPIIINLFLYSLEYLDNFDKQVKEILKFASEHNYRYLDSIKLSSKDLKVDFDGVVSSESEEYGNVFYIVDNKLIKYEGIEKYYDEIMLINKIKCKIENKIDTITGIYRREKSDNLIEYEFYETIKKDSLGFIDTYKGTDEDGFDIFKSNDVVARYGLINSAETIVDLVKKIITIQNYNTHSENRDDVFVHGNLIENNVFHNNGMITKVIGWNNIKYGDKSVDIFDVILNYIKINRYSYEDRTPLDKLLTIIEGANLLEYFDDEFVNKMIKYLENRINLLNKKDHNYQRDYFKINHEITWFNFNRLEIDKI